MYLNNQKSEYDQEMPQVTLYKKSLRKASRDIE